MSDISLEPLLNASVLDLTIGRGTAVVATDGQGNALLLDSLSWEMRFDYTGSPTAGQPVYGGYAKADTSVGDATWLVHKYTYDGSGFITRRQVATGSWTGRAALFP